MLRHSLTVLVLLFLLGLVMILGYAVWNREASTDALAEASALLDEDRAAEALRLLNHTERTLGPNGDTELRRRLYELRYQAHERAGNQRYALRDIGLLQRAFGKPPADAQRSYALARIRLLLGLGRTDPEDWDRALDQARAELSEHRGDHELRELTGQILQALYRRDLSELVSIDLPLLLPSEDLDRAVEAIRNHVFRELTDPEGMRQRDILENILRIHVADPRELANLLSRTAAIRERILETSEHYRFALRGTQPAYAALQGYCGQLLRSDRADEAAALSWLYLLRFPRRFGSVFAVSRALESFIAIGNVAQACRVGAYWLEKNPIDEVVEKRRLNKTYLDAYLLYVRALHRQKDDVAIDTLVTQLMKHNKRYNALFWPDMNWIFGLLSDLRKDVDGLERSLADFCKAYAWSQVSRPGGQVDWYREALQLRYDAARERGNDARVDAVLEEWIKSRPKDVEARLTRAQRLLERQEVLLCVSDANVVINSIEATSAEREDALRLRLEARNRQFAAEGRDARSILATLIRDDGSSIVVPDPVLHIGVAELALDAGLQKIARRSIRAAAETLQWSSTLRLLQARDALARGEDPLYDIEQVLESDPSSLQARLLMIDALEQTQASPDRMARAWYDLIRTNPKDTRAIMRLGELLIRRGAYDLALELGSDAQVDEQTKRELAWVRGRSLLGLNRATEAIDVLTTLPIDSPNRRPALALAMETAARLEQHERLPQLRRLLLKSEPDADTLRKTAEVLASQRQYREALELLLEISERNPNLVAGRDGRLFVLIGRLLHAMGQPAAAQENWGAAYSFKDGSEAIPLLALSLVFEDKLDEAREVLQLSPQLSGDPVLLSYLWFRLDRKKEAVAALRGFVMPERSLLLPPLLRQSLHLAAKMPGEADGTPYPWFDKVISGNPELCFEALALSRGIAFEERAGEAMRNVESFFQGDDMFTKSAIGTLRAYQDLLAGRELRAADKLANVVSAHIDFFPAYDELFLLVEDESPDLLMTPDMLYRYANLTDKLPIELVKSSRFPLIAFLGLAKVSAKKGDPAAEKKFYDMAHALSPDDPQPLRALAKAAKEKGDLVTALERQFEVIDRVTGRMRVEELRFAFALALAALETEDGKSADSTLGRLVRRAGDQAQFHRDRVARKEAEPLGHAAVLQIRLDAIKRDQTDADRRANALGMLAASLRPIVEGRVPPHRDLEGLLLVLREVAERQTPEEVRQTIEKILVRDTSLLDIWLLASEIEERFENIEGAVADIAWITDVLPSYRAALEQLVRLRGRHPVKTPSTYESLLEAVPDENETAWARGVLHARLGNALVAAETFAANTSELAPPEAILRDLNKIYASGPDGEFGDVEQRLTRHAKSATGRTQRIAEDVAVQLALLVDDRTREIDDAQMERERGLLRRTQNAPETRTEERRREALLRRDAEIARDKNKE